MGQTVGRIKKNYAQLRASERKVADWVLRDPAKVPEMTMAQLAAAAGVSEPTVARFAEAAGFEGFSALKLALAKEAAPAANPYRKVVHPREAEPPCHPDQARQAEGSTEEEAIR